MSYEPTTWKKGDKVTSTKLNKIEQGIQGNDTGLANVAEDVSDLKEGLSEFREEVFVPSPNLYDPNAAVVGLLNSSGNVVTGYPQYTTTDFIPVSYPQNICIQSASYRLSLGVQVCEYDENHDLVGARYNPLNGNVQSYFVTFAIVNSGAKYIRISFQNTLFDVSTVMITYGTERQNYFPFGLYNELTATFANKIQKSIGVKVTSDKVFASTKYSSDTDLCVVFGKHGANNLPDFWKVRTVGNENRFPLINDDDSQFTTLLSISTDWHSPFVVKALNNIDGDKPSVNDYTGGNHNYNNTDRTGYTPTATCDSLRFFIDNQETTDFVGYCNTLKIKWSNRVQATNTKKEDGSGRYVLRENHEIIFDGVRWQSTVEIIPLEEINIITYYGFQTSGIQTVYPNVRFVGALNRGVYSSSSVGESGDNIVNGIKIYGNNDSVELNLDTTFDLGNRRFYNGTKGAYNTANKAYFYLIDHLSPCAANNAYFAKCDYVFSHT